jgi:hypothetical protein
MFILKKKEEMFSEKWIIFSKKKKKRKNYTVQHHNLEYLSGKLEIDGLIILKYILEKTSMFVDRSNC